MIGSVDESYWERLAKDRGEATNRMSSEIAELNEIISQCAQAAGAFVHPSASIEFKRLLPGEIKAVVARLSSPPAEQGRKENSNG